MSWIGTLQADAQQLRELNCESHKAHRVPTVESKFDFRGRSQHLRMTVRGTLAAIGRLTPVNPETDGVCKNWAVKPPEDLARYMRAFVGGDISRIVVAKTHRDQRYLAPLLVALVRNGRDGLGLRTFAAYLEHGCHHANVFYRLGFKHIGDTTIRIGHSMTNTMEYVVLDLDDPESARKFRAEARCAVKAFHAARRLAHHLASRLLKAIRAN